MIRFFYVVMLLGVVALVIYDSHFHFDAELVELKRDNFSGQRNWSVFYAQRHVWADGGLRYIDEFEALQDHLTPGALLVSDLATSYQAAAMLPVVVLNVHAHHGRGRWHQWVRFLESRVLCYLEHAENRQKSRDFLSGQRVAGYLLINRDRATMHRQRDCLAFQSDVINQHMPEIAELVWAGEFLSLYRLP